PATKTLTYTRCNDPHGYQLLPAAFRRGDRVMLYTMSGRLVADGFVTSDTVRISPDGVKPMDERYTVMLSEDIDLPEDEQVVVQNTSASGNGFLLDNVLIRNEGARGIRIKAVDGEIRNCTFDGISKGGIDCIPEFSLWPECGYVRNVRIVKNMFRNLARTARLCENDESEWCAPICIRYTLWDKGANATSAPAYCLHRDIEISDNVFTGRYSHYEITVSAVQNLRIVNNRFEDVNSGAIPSEKQYPVMINGGNGIVFDGNSFPERMEKRIFYHYGKDTTDNVSGSDAL
ncbi:MAG: hypothetical protein ACI3XQ_00915, partial [Eubacteriales bacterium]